jgi:hypothetical protein
MKTQLFASSLKVAALLVALFYGAGAQAATLSGALALNTGVGSQNEFQPIAFSDSAEAQMLRNAYQILATGDHDYNGHRVRAMRAVENGAKLLGMNLAGDLKDRSPQPLSDAKLREAQGLILQALGSAQVSSQKRVAARLNKAVSEINTALSIR